MRRALAPHVLERFRRHGGVAYLVGDAGVAQEVLQPACIHSFRRQGIPGRMPQHVNVNRKRQVGDLATPLDHASDAHTAERLSALVHEYVGRPDALRCIAALERLEAGVRPAPGSGGCRCCL